MKLSNSEMAQINDRLSSKREVTCTVFDYAKSIELFVNDEIRGRYRRLAQAKHTAKCFKARNPDLHVKVVESKKKVHEFNIRQSAGDHHL